MEQAGIRKFFTKWLKFFNFSKHELATKSVLAI